MHEVGKALWLFFGSPLAQFWLFVGLSVGAIYGLWRRKHWQELFWTTAIVLAPPIIILPFSLSMIKSHSDFWVWIGIMVNVLYVMTGFIGFCMTWIPGVVLGCLFGSAIERSDQNGTKA